MKFKVGDVVQVHGNYKLYTEGLRKFKIVILAVKRKWFRPNKYKVLSLDFGKTWDEKEGPAGLEKNFHKTGEVTKEELSLLRKIYE